MGATESSQKESKSSSVIDRMFCCPVCYEKYNSHIMMCQSGHAVCRKCFERLNMCPQCSAKYSGTRNYILEELISELEKINCSPERAVNAVKEASETPQTPQSDEVRTVRTGYARVVWETYEEETTVCLMDHCHQTMPLKNLEHHLLAHHSSFVKRVKAKKYLSRSYFKFSSLCDDQIFAILTEFGIFFVIVRTIWHFSNCPLVRAWIQGACTNKEASLFYYWLQVKVTDTRASNHDIVQGNEISSSHIQEKMECVAFAVQAEDQDRLKVRGYVCLNKSKSILPHRRGKVCVKKRGD